MEVKCNSTWKIRNVCRMLAGKLGRKQSLRSPRRRWEESIKNNFKEDVNWIRVNTEIKILAPYFSGMAVLCLKHPSGHVIS